MQSPQGRDQSMPLALSPLSVTSIAAAAPSATYGHRAAITQEKAAAAVRTTAAAAAASTAPAQSAEPLVGVPIKAEPFLVPFELMGPFLMPAQSEGINLPSGLQRGPAITPSNTCQSLSISTAGRALLARHHNIGLATDEELARAAVLGTLTKSLDMQSSSHHQPLGSHADTQSFRPSPDLRLSPDLLCGLSVNTKPSPQLSYGQCSGDQRNPQPSYSAYPGGLADIAGALLNGYRELSLTPPGQIRDSRLRAGVPWGPSPRPSLFQGPAANARQGPRIKTTVRTSKTGTMPEAAVKVVGSRRAVPLPQSPIAKQPNPMANSPSPRAISHDSMDLLSQHLRAQRGSSSPDASISATTVTDSPSPSPGCETLTRATAPANGACQALTTQLEPGAAGRYQAERQSQQNQGAGSTASPILQTATELDCSESLEKHSPPPNPSSCSPADCNPNSAPAAQSSLLPIAVLFAEPQSMCTSAQASQSPAAVCIPDVLQQTLSNAKSQPTSLEGLVTSAAEAVLKAGQGSQPRKVGIQVAASAAEALHAVSSQPAQRTAAQAWDAVSPQSELAAAAQAWNPVSSQPALVTSGVPYTVSSPPAQRTAAQAWNPASSQPALCTVSSRPAQATDQALLTVSSSQPAQAAAAQALCSVSSQPAQAAATEALHAVGSPPAQAATLTQGFGLASSHSLPDEAIACQQQQTDQQVEAPGPSLLSTNILAATAPEASAADEGDEEWTPDDDAMLAASALAEMADSHWQEGDILQPYHIYYEQNVITHGYACCMWTKLFASMAWHGMLWLL